MADYDLSKAFERIERELIDSMMRNLDAHRAEETARGYNWEQWQALQLKALEKYRTTNRKKFTQPFNALNNEIAQMLRDSYNDGATEQEKKILQQVKKGYKGAGTNAGAQTGTAEVGGEFFKTNNRKLDALVQATTHDMNRAEHAVLRRANDQYRKIIFSAQVYANTGAGTYEKAVDMATRDFLRAGINGIQYRNGSQHSITEYARMAIKTASTRAYLQGEGDMRKEMGIPTVILNKRTNACPLCAPFVGKVFIDDVWSGGSSTGISPVTGAKYPLLSDAIAAGLYHPNCRDIHTTYFEGINTAPEGSTYTKEELQAMADTYKAEQEESYCERQAERCERLEEYSLDKDNKAQYAARAVNWRRRSAKCSSKLKLCKKRLAELSESTDESGISEAPAVENSTVKSVEAVKNNPVETVEKSSGSGIIVPGSDNMPKLQNMGQLDTELFQHEFGILKTNEIIITSERLEHIKIRHPEDFELFESYGTLAVVSPDLIIKDEKNDNTVFMILRLENTNLNVVVKLILETDERDYKNSVMTFYRIRNKNLEKLMKKNKTIYKK